MSIPELVERFTLERVGASPAVFDFQKLDHFNGVYLRAMDPTSTRHALVLYLRRAGLRLGRGARSRERSRSCRRRSRSSPSIPEFAGFLFRDVEPDPALLDGRVLEEAERALAEVEPFTTEAIEQALRALAEQLDLKPREAFQPIRVAVTGSKVSPGLFESIELLGPRAHARPDQACAGGNGLGAANGSSARWNSRQARAR